MNKNRTENIVDGEITLAKLDTTGATAGQSIIMGASAPVWGTSGTATTAESLASGDGTLSFSEDTWTFTGDALAEVRADYYYGAFIGDGSQITGIADSALSANVALIDGDNTFTGNNSFTGGLTFAGLAIASGKTLTVSKTMTLTSSDDTSVITLPAGIKTLLATDGSAANLTAIPAAQVTGAAALPDAVLSSNVPLLNAANAFTNAQTYQPGAAYDTATLGEEILDDTTWTLGSGWTYVSGTDWTQGFIHSGAITAVSATPTAGGTGYTLNDVLTVTTGDGTATVTATGVTGGVVTAVTLTSGGTTGYRGGTGQATSGGTGSGCTVNVTGIAGGTATLTQSDAATNGAYYQIAYTVTGRTAGTFTIAYGGVTSPAISATGTWGPKATSTAGLTVTPSTTFDGQVVLSIKPIITPSSPTLAIKDSTGANNFEIQSSPQSLFNTFIGLTAGSRVTTGKGNTLVGVSAGPSNTTGVNNSFFGWLSGNANTTGGNNAFYGQQSGYSNVAGNMNTYLGMYAGRASTGSANTFVGQGAGVANTSANYGTYVGQGAGSANTTGVNNTFIGTGAGGTNTTGASSIAIGFMSGRYSTAGNEFYINNKDQGNTENEKANSLLYGVMGANAAAQTLAVNGKLKVDPTGVSYAAPTEALDVTGNIKASGGVTANTFPLIQWRGSSASDPTENLAEGQMYWNTSGSLKIYTGSAWVIVGVGP